MIGESPVFRKVVEQVARMAAFDVSVLIEGETGTGKELVARALHYQSPRKNQPFVPVNCGAIPESLVENEIFGHRRGSFTSATENQPGLISMARQGTLFFDEVDALPLKGQTSLLRFLEDYQYRPLGEKDTVSADVRIVAASNQDLASMCKTGTFRQDLLHRLQVLQVRVPPLRERKGDAALLGQYFTNQTATKFSLPPMRLSEETLEWFEDYEWPGNVRELQHLVLRECILSGAPVLCIPSPSACASGFKSTDLNYREAKAKAIESFEIRFLGDVMRRTEWNVSLAARLIGTERRHLGRLLQRYGITRSRP